MNDLKCYFKPTVLAYLQRILGITKWRVLLLNGGIHVERSLESSSLTEPTISATERVLIFLYIVQPIFKCGIYSDIPQPKPVTNHSVTSVHLTLQKKQHPLKNVERISQCGQHNTQISKIENKTNCGYLSQVVNDLTMLLTRT